MYLSFLEVDEEISLSLLRPCRSQGSIMYVTFSSHGGGTLKGQAGEESCRLHRPAFLFYQPREASSEEGLEDFCVYSGCMGTFQCTGEECEAGGFTSHA